MDDWRANVRIPANKQQAKSNKQQTANSKQQAERTARRTGAVRAKRAVPLEARWVFNRALRWRARCYFRARSCAVRGDYLKAGVCRRFLCFCFFVAVGQRNEVPPRTGANGTKQETPTLNSLRPKQNRPDPSTSGAALPPRTGANKWQARNPNSPAKAQATHKPAPQAPAVQSLP